jgi:hypothetical protein
MALTEQQRAYQRAYRESHKEELAEYNRKYREANADYYKERRQVYYQAHKEEIKEQVRQRKLENPDKVRECNRNYYKNNKEDCIAYQKEYRKTYKNTDGYKQSIRRRNLKRYGLTLEAFDEMITTQDGRCAICERKAEDVSDKPLAVDHSHTTGKVRGLLCQFCNTALGSLREDIDVMQKMIAYVEQHN